MPFYTVQIKEQPLAIATSNNMFSPSSLDRGTAAMLSAAEFLPEDKILDLGCGCGPVGILAARLTSPKQVTMSDISEEAVSLAAQNAAANGVGGIRILCSDGFSGIADTDFTKILSNPPYHTDFSVAKSFIEQSFRHLAPGGVLYMVTKRREWYKNKLIAVFGGVQITELDGYYVFTAQKRTAQGCLAQKQKAPVTAAQKQGMRPEAGTENASGSRPAPQHTEKAAGQTRQLSRKLARKQQRRARARNCFHSN